MTEDNATAVTDDLTITAIELFHFDGRPSGIWYCSECRAVQTDKHQAQRCHGVTHCETCGVSLGKRAPYYRKQCDGCDQKDWRARQAKEEFERYTKAVKIAASEYTGPQVFFNDQYYPTVEEAIDGCDECPEYVWAAKNIGLRKATLEDLIERVLEEAWEDADSDDLNGLDELQAAVDVFNEANSGIDVYMVDHDEAIVLDASILEEWRREQGATAVVRASAELEVRSEMETETNNEKQVPLRDVALLAANSTRNLVMNGIIHGFANKAAVLALANQLEDAALREPTEDRSALVDSDPGKMDGVPCIAGTRIPVTCVLRAIALNVPLDAISTAYSQLSAEHAKAALWHFVEATKDHELQDTMLDYKRRVEDLTTACERRGLRVGFGNKGEVTLEEAR